MYQLAGPSTKCCNNYLELDVYHSCLPRALPKKVFLHLKWLETPVDERQYCAFPDCCEFIPPIYEYYILRPRGVPAHHGSRMYEPEASEARRRMFCPACERDSEIPRTEDEAPVLTEAQKRFPWLPAGTRTLLPAGSPPSAAMMSCTRMS